MMLPLITGDSQAPLLWRNQQVITRGHFIQTATQLAHRLPDNKYLVNLCASRTGFLLAWVAAAIQGKHTLLPPNQSETALLQLRQACPDQFAIDDTCLDDLSFSTRTQDRIQLAGENIIATLYTSGSTGVPQAHSKTWASLSHVAHLDSQRCTPTPFNLVATVPSQHMFGLQTTVLLPLLGNCAIHDGKPFFPADIRMALESVPAPRALITTPAHLRTCISSGLQVPDIEFVLSATAPLPLELAQQTESMWNTRVLEFYGSTEAGAMGTRRTTEGDAWLLHPGTQIVKDMHGTYYRAPHLSEPLLLNDQIELLDEHHFQLLGRDSDQVKIAGKRGSLNELTRVLLNIDGVQDGVVFMPSSSAERTAALVVAPHVDAATILDALARSVDPVFLPRPLMHVDALPRNEVGKLTQRALLDALNSHSA